MMLRDADDQIIDFMPGEVQWNQLCFSAVK